MRIERRVCPNCEGFTLQRVLDAGEALEAWPVEITLTPFEGCWNVEILLCGVCRTVTVTCASVGPVAEEILPLFPPVKGERQ